MDTPAPATKATDTTPGLWTPPLAEPARAGWCTDCGVLAYGRSGALRAPASSSAPTIRPWRCAFTAAPATPGGRRKEDYFGPFLSMHQAALKQPRPGAQWDRPDHAPGPAPAGNRHRRCRADHDRRSRGPLAPAPGDRHRPGRHGRLSRHAHGLCPLLALLEPAIEQGHRRLAVIGIPCQIHALRAPGRPNWGWRRSTSSGRQCSDNTTTENFRHFLGLLTKTPEQVTYLEFRADFRVELRFTDGRTRLIPFLKLPISKLPRDFFPLTCRTCVDYTNALADITVGYLGRPGRAVGCWCATREPGGARRARRRGCRSSR